MARGGSRKKRKQRQRSRSITSAAAHEPPPPQAAEPSAGAEPADPASGQAVMRRGYSRSRQRDEEARAKLKPLAPGERPTAVTVGAIVALALAVANVVALIVRYDPDEGGKTMGTLLVTVLLLVVAWGMWKARYWAVLGMQTLLAFTIIGAALGAATALNLSAVLLVVGILLPAAALFWFLVKAMARIQMPPRPGSQSR